MLIYLAGPIRGLTYDEATDWRAKATNVLRGYGHRTISPMRGKEHLKDFGPLWGDAKSGTFEEFPMSSAEGVWGRDIFDVARCDALLANLEGATDMSIGTVMELQRAYDCGKYSVVVLDRYGRFDHAFVRGAASLVVRDLETALQVLVVLGEPYAKEER